MLEDFTIQIDFDRWAKVTMTRKGKVCRVKEYYLIHPYTPELRARAARQRGRGWLNYEPSCFTTIAGAVTKVRKPAEYGDSWKLHKEGETENAD